MRRPLLAVAFLLVSASFAGAQSQKPVTFSVGASVVPPLSGTADNFSTGFGLAGGVTWNLSEQMGLKFDYMYSGLDGKDAAQTTTPISAKLNTQFVTGAFMFQGPPGAFRLYLLAGIGLYHRSVSLETSGSGSVTVCNPWWFVCSAQPMPAASLAGSRSATSFGVNVGAGFTANRFFAEARYHYMTGPSYDTPSGSQKATGKFFPLTLGVRF